MLLFRRKALGLEVSGIKHIARGHEQSPLHNVGQLADIARPGLRLQQLHGFRSDFRRFPACGGRCFPQQMFY